MKEITKDILEKEYSNSNRNIKETAKFLGVSSAALRRRLNKFDIKIKPRRFEDLTGNRYGKWTVIEYNSKSKEVSFLCICDCGYKKINKPGSLKRGSSTQCINCYHKSLANDTEQITPTIFGKILSGAKKRGIEITVSIEYCWELFLLQDRKCNISGLPISFALTSQDHQHSCSTASLDRIDSSKGYIVGNVQWVHKHINRMKWAFTQDYLMYLCTLISNFNPISTESLKMSEVDYRNPIKVNSRQKLTDDDIKEIRKLKNEGKTNIEISNIFNCTPSNISLILRGISRRNVK